MKNIDPHTLRLDGIYQQKGEDRWMQRIKLPAGVLSSRQATSIADLADRFAGGRLHLTTRGSIELHDLRGHDLAELNRQLVAVGLTGRGACGGAVRGISCSASFGPRFPACQSLARRLHRHFTGNPWFEGLPKKFKIGIEGSTENRRHLIQDIGLVFAGEREAEPLWDVWCGGGLGREPKPALLLAERVPERRLIPLIEGVLVVYRNGAKKGKRLKHLITEIGEAEFRDRLRAATPEPFDTLVRSGLGELLSPATDEEPVLVPVFAGELRADQLRRMARLADEYAGGCLAVTGNQDIAFAPTSEKNRAALQQRLNLAGPGDSLCHPAPTFRICPGSHECRMGLAPTRDIAAGILENLPAAASGLSLAISGCPNSCSQPQLADIGIVTRSLKKGPNGMAEPRFDLLLGENTGLGHPLAQNIGIEDLQNRIIDVLITLVNSEKIKAAS
ncbi:MAG: nitrite/sulfite reductase [Deltaproteobacteria bacterium]|nr:MAG: nitrite/sulfite reductase [Deltaproteobacteria bacterium]